MWKGFILTKSGGKNKSPNLMPSTSWHCSLNWHAQGSQTEGSGNPLNHDIAGYFFIYLISCLSPVTEYPAYVPITVEQHMKNSTDPYKHAHSNTDKEGSYSYLLSTGWPWTELSSSSQQSVLGPTLQACITTRKILDTCVHNKPHNMVKIMKFITTQQETDKAHEYS